MKISRHFTTAGADVFAGVDWATRTSRISGTDGRVVFEMNDAEVPAAWSQLATDIMVSKYFRKAGVPQLDADGNPELDAAGAPVTGPERSARQVIHRLAVCWRNWGHKHGYFDSPADADAFYDELCHMMLRQMCAPNSPQWFNTGLHDAYGIQGPAQGHWYADPETGEARLSEDAYTHPQPHACFIQSVDDDLVGDDGIMSLWTREARLFKYGSGTGTNFSSIRGEDEPLAGGGKSSGLMSFLKIGDRAAGAIKSGGTTRRAAKMCCLDLDHPDVEQFVNWKVREEIKVAALVAGMKALEGRKTSPEDPETLGETAARLGLNLDYDFNGEAYATVSGQNSNNSVRIPNAFFEAVANDSTWDLTRRTDGAVAKTLDATKLWDAIGYAAWRCADPGVQYDSTINDWHTCPEAGRINASNPCVTGDTLVATAEGLRTIESMVGETPEVVGLDGNLHRTTRVIPTGTKPVYRLRTASGYELKLTADHLVWTVNRGDVPAAELTRDDRVRLLPSPLGEEALDADVAEYVGLMLGDGCVSGGIAQLTMNAVGESLVLEKAAATANRFARHRGSVAVTQRTTSSCVATCARSVTDELAEWAVLGAGSSAKRLTERALRLEREPAAALLRGLFTADGCVVDSGEKSQYVGLDSTSELLLTQVQTMLLGFGIKSKIYRNRRLTKTALLPDGNGGHKEYAVQQMHALRITRCGRFRFAEAIGFMPESGKAQQLTDLNERVGVYADQPVDRVASLELLGEEPVFDLTEPFTEHFVANGIAVHNCSEYMFLDDTACNLASLNLLTFFDSETATFDAAAFEHGVSIWTMVLEISVLMAQFPSRAIAENSYRFRTLGLGYANLGAMLMRAGIPYDSDRGRAIAGCVTAILTGRSYATSAEMASELGAFPAYENNLSADPAGGGNMLRVIRNHRRAAYGIPSHADAATKSELGDYERIGVRPVPIHGADLTSDHEACGKLANGEELLARARAAWDDALAGGEAHGYRNAQATVLAPTGTIGLLMDCDTTGVEPDFALVKFKKLAGGGYFKIVNQSLPPALASLGYAQREVDAILQHVLGTLHLDVPLTAEGKTDNTRSFREWLTDRGFTAEDLAKVEAGLPGVFELGMAFSVWALGEQTLERLGLDPDAAKAPGFSVLEKLGLRRGDVTAMNAIVCGTQTVEGAPHLKDDHLAVFDCANTCGPTGERYIAASGHIRMMAAAQPFLSGAISKTINLPHDASVADIQDAYRTSWELGIKANALYRDGCKLSQPLNTSSSNVEDVEEEADDDAAIAEALQEVAGDVAAAAGAAAGGQAIERIVERVVERPMRRRLPDTRLSRTHKFNVAGHEGYLTVGLHEDGAPGELFITMAKEGSTIGGLMDTLGTAVSVALQYGVPIESLVKKFSHQRFEPAGMTHNPDIPFAKSLVDYIFRWLGIEFVEGYREQVVPRRASVQAAPTPPTLHPGAAVVQRAAAAPRNPRTATESSSEAARSAGSTLSEAMSSLQSDAPACDGCGSITVRNGTCYRCLNCGASMGCS